MSPSAVLWVSIISSGSFPRTGQPSLLSGFQQKVHQGAAQGEIKAQGSVLAARPEEIHAGFEASWFTLCLESHEAANSPAAVAER